ncbi:MAG: glycosyltransferase family 4 protein [bacterium]|nr:glycosyltransferase family 4 protein [bacterium]
MTMLPMPQVALASYGDPFSKATLSGTAFSVAEALDRGGWLASRHNAAGFLDPFVPGPPLIRLLRRLDRLSLEERFRWSRPSTWMFSRQAERSLGRASGHNVCLLIGTNFCPRVGVPVYCYLDTTAAQVMCANVWDLTGASNRLRKRAVAFQQEVFDACRCVFTFSRWAAQSVIEDYGVPEDRVCVLGCGANFQEDPPRHGPYDGRTILFVGRDWERKGGPVLLESFRIVRQSLPDARLIIVGRPPPIDEPGVEVVGLLDPNAADSGRRLREFYQQASVFCMMSVFEPFGFATLEAMASGLPCVVPARFAFTEAVVDGVTGFTVDGYEPEAVAGALVTLLRDAERLGTMGEAARARALGEFTWDAVARRMTDRMAEDLDAADKGET